MPPTSIDWGTASVEDGQLTVAYEGKPSGEWRERLEAVLDRLATGGTAWGEIKVGKSKLRIDGVQAGAEGDLRHLLESAVLQANADSGDAESEEPADEEQRSDADQAMTEAFRAFADR